MWCMELSLRCCAEMNIHIDLMRVSQRISVVSSRKSSHLYCAVEHGIPLEQMRGKCASSCVDFGYTDLFCIPELRSEFISSCDSVLRDSLVFYQENGGSLRV